MHAPGVSQDVIQAAHGEPGPGTAVESPMASTSAIPAADAALTRNPRSSETPRRASPRAIAQAKAPACGATSDRRTGLQNG